MLHIDPVESIDCGAGVPVCPVSAISTIHSTNGEILRSGTLLTMADDSIKDVRHFPPCLQQRLTPSGFYVTARLGSEPGRNDRKETV